MTNLYETDFLSWIEDQVNLLKTQQWQQLDTLNLIVAIRETKIGEQIFPEVCPYTLEQTLDPQFLPI